MTHLENLIAKLKEFDFTDKEIVEKIQSRYIYTEATIKRYLQ